MTDELDGAGPVDDPGLLRAEALESVWFIDPSSPGWAKDDLAMPEDVWSRLSRALRDEAIDRSAVDGTVPITAALSRGRSEREAASARRPAARSRSWLMGSIAAGVALLGVGVVVQSVQSSREVPLVAGAPQAGPQLRGAPAMEEPAPLPASTIDPPARRVLASGTDYQPQTLRSQVVDLLEGLGATQPGDLASMQTDGPTTVGTDGFTATLPALRACITGLTQSELAQALIVDRASFSGDDAGLVVVPEDFVLVGGDEPTATAQTPSGAVDIWVVEPDCSRVDPGVILHLLHRVTAE